MRVEGGLPELLSQGSGRQVWASVRERGKEAKQRKTGDVMDTQRNWN